MDYIGPFNPPSANGYKYTLIGGDYFSRYGLANAFPEATAVGKFILLPKLIDAGLLLCL
jgi:hypothetical protein